MEFKKIIEVRESEPMEERVLRVCRSFADVIAGGDWFEPTSREVVVRRSFTESIGFDIYDPEAYGERIKESTIKTQLDFIGTKEAIRVDEDEDTSLEPELEESYIVRAIVTEVIGFAELPEHIKRDLIELISSKTRMRERVRRMVGIDATIEITRQQTVEYFIDDSGDIDNYSITSQYNADNKVLNEASYSWNDQLGDDEEDDLVDETGADESMVSDEAFRDVSEKAILTDDEDSHRVLGMIALISTGFSAPKRHLRK